MLGLFQSIVFTVVLGLITLTLTACPKAKESEVLTNDPKSAESVSSEINDLHLGYTTERSTVKTVKVVKEKLSSGIEYSGTVEASKSAMVSPKLMALIEEMPIAEGDVVAKGQLIARLDKRDLDAQLLQANAGVLQAEAAYQQALAATEEGSAGMIQAEAALELAAKNLKRYRTLYEEESISKSQFEEVEANFKYAQSGVEQVRKKIAQADAAAGQARAGKNQAEAQVQSIKIMMSYAVVTAPFAGIVSKKFMDVGAMTAPGQPLVRIESQDALELAIAVPESDLKGIKAGDSINVYIDALSEEIGGYIKALVASGDPMTHTFKLRISLPKYDGLLAGMYGKIRLGDDESESLIIPQSALATRGAVTGVFKLNDDRILSFVPVEKTDYTSDKAVVLRGLNEGDNIVVNPDSDLVDGQKVNLG